MENLSAIVLSKNVFSASSVLNEARAIMADVEPRLMAESKDIESPMSLAFLKKQKVDEWTDEEHFWKPIEIGYNSTFNFCLVFEELKKFAVYHRRAAPTRCRNRPDVLCDQLCRCFESRGNRWALRSLVKKVAAELLPYFDNNWMKLYEDWKKSCEYKTIFCRYVRMATEDGRAKLWEHYNFTRGMATGISLMLATQRFHIPHISLDHDGTVYVYHRKPDDDGFTWDMRNHAFVQSQQDPEVDQGILEALESVYPPELVAIIFNYARSGPLELTNSTLTCNHNHTSLQECLR